MILVVALLACRPEDVPEPADVARESADVAPEPVDVAPEAFTTRSADVMHTRIVAVLPDGPDADAEAALVWDAFRGVEERANEWKETSALGRVNRGAGGRPIAVDDDTYALVARSVDVARRTDGAFDPTWAALWDQWDFRADPPRLPDPDVVAERVTHVGWQRVQLDADAKTVGLPDPAMRLGLGGIAKGHALDLAAAALKARGVRNFALSAGGQVYASGRHGDRPWSVGLRDPRGDRDDSFALVDVADASVSTSGDYEHCFFVDGVRYHHILDPKTGWPARGVRSATVVAADATLADGLSTAMVVLGVDQGSALARQLGVEVVYVDDQGGVHATDGIAGRLTTVHAPRR